MPTGSDGEHNVLPWIYMHCGGLVLTELEGFGEFGCLLQRFIIRCMVLRHRYCAGREHWLLTRCMFYQTIGTNMASKPKGSQCRIEGRDIPFVRWNHVACRFYLLAASVGSGGSCRCTGDVRLVTNRECDDGSDFNSCLRPSQQLRRIPGEGHSQRYGCPPQCHETRSNSD